MIFGSSVGFWGSADLMVQILSLDLFSRAFIYALLSRPYHCVSYRLSCFKVTAG